MLCSFNVISITDFGLADFIVQGIKDVFLQCEGVERVYSHISMLSTPGIELFINNVFRANALVHWLPQCGCDMHSCVETFMAAIYVNVPPAKAEHITAFYNFFYTPYKMKCILSVGNDVYWLI